MAHQSGYGGRKNRGRFKKFFKKFRDRFRIKDRTKLGKTQFGKVDMPSRGERRPDATDALGQGISTAFPETGGAIPPTGAAQVPDGGGMQPVTDYGRLEQPLGKAGEFDVSGKQVVAGPTQLGTPQDQQAMSTALPPEQTLEGQPIPQEEQGAFDKFKDWLKTTGMSVQDWISKSREGTNESFQDQSAIDQMLSITPGGGLVAGTTKKIVGGKVVKGFVKRFGGDFTIEGAKNILKTIGTKWATKMDELRLARMTKAFGIEATDDIIARYVKQNQGKGLAEMMKGISGKTLAAGGIGAAFVGYKVAEVDVMMNWYTIDNVIGGQKFYIRDVLAGMEDGTLNPVDAAAAVEESKMIREAAIRKVKLSTIINPLMWSHRKLVLAGMDADETAIGLMEAQIKAISNKAAGEDGVLGSDDDVSYEDYTFDWWEKDNARWAEIQENMQLAREEQRLEDQEYWAGIFAANEARREAQRKADAEYWAEIMENKEANAGGGLGFGLL